MRAAKSALTALPQRGGECQYPQPTGAGTGRNGRRPEPPLLGATGATNPQRGPNAPIGRDGGSVAPPMVEPLEQLKEAVADTGKARNGDEMERQRRQDRQSDAG